ncbi:MAG: DUF523 domain-containing protein [Chromatiales bacterium]|nr:DUF523 domain-containing protein [Chromatiales bacterium]
MLPTIAISRCLVGDPVRYDGESKFKPKLIKKLEDIFTLIPICPEVEIGLSVPRPPIHIVERKSVLKVVVIEDSDRDLTEPLQSLAREKAKLQIDGFILKARSPSCGLTSTPHLLENGTVIYGAGIFTDAFHKANPQIPMIEAEMLESPQQFKKFIEEVTAATTNC